MKIMVVPEDPSLDQYVLKPVVERIFADLGKSPRIQILSRPRLRGVAQALNAAVLADIVETYPMVDLFLVIVDRDGRVERQAEAAAREREHQEGDLFVCLAIEEIEVWMLAIHRHSIEHEWSAIRAEPHPKERFADPFLAARAPKLDVGGGRAWAMQDLGNKWKGVLEVCPELAELKQRITVWLGARQRR